MSYNQYSASASGMNMPNNAIANGHSTAAPLSDAQRPNTASPAALPGSTPQNPPLMRKRKKQQTNPLVPNRRPGQKPNRPPRPPPQANGGAKPGALQARPLPAAQHSTTGPPQRPLPQPTQSIPIYTTPKHMVEGLRHHVLRLHPPPARSKVDLFDESQFTPPLRLHRRDPRAPAVGAGPIEEVDDGESNQTDDKERERLEIMKEERKRIREENQAQIAPAVKKNKPAAFQKKTEQVYRRDDTPEARKKSALRYEESLPWHLEDFDNKNTWVGTYEAALSDHYVMLVKDQNGCRLVPVEKWYRFTSKQRGKTWTADQADAAFQAKAKAPRWFAAAEEKDAEKKMKMREQKLTRKLHLGASDNKRPRGGDDERGEVEDIGEMDYNAEEDFADDEEGVNGLFEGEDEDTKETSERIKKEQAAANAFELRDEKDVWKQEEIQQKAAEEQRKLEKQIRKALLKREKNYDYEQDSDGNKYFSDSSESLDSDEERKREEEQKKEEEKKAKAKEKEPKEAEKPKQTSSGTSTKGTNTPSGRPKTSDVLKKATNNLKRPGSPNLSEMSGNESSRKKSKKKHALSQPTHTNARPMSPDNAPSSSAPTKLKSKLRGGAGSGSDSDMTEGGRKQKLKLRLSPPGTPGGSRAGSPAVVGGSTAGSAVLSAGGTNRMQGTSPASGTATPTGVSSAATGRPPPEEVVAAIPPEGLTMSQLMRIFKPRLRTPEDKAEFSRSLRPFVRLDKDTKMLYRKDI
ncbi:hypothetical protein EJ05DRAFT_473665 [Pseudovirgaria hyperparasitica]|uniref:Uncharacterized protein n=1 Tax=Pseudovirgaria hyperparasitica TaxID=470096 RepID=A0A6A6WEZ2_9PEZI|nr:uncharacterized protein EJ05DRAFT_473665 [Pseudovirgaria hyperparasitica]KAF2761105.1 hypothetical protein EJ05DRAFT_473665 [Pseudovirgaria hyperparasitica]